MLPFSGEEKEDPVIEPNLNHWSAEGGNIHFLESFVLWYLEFRPVDKVHEPSDSEKETYSKKLVGLLFKFDTIFFCLWRYWRKYVTCDTTETKLYQKHRFQQTNTRATQTLL
jgi:hypothetical protein